MTNYITKRNGESVEYDGKRIESAVYRAAEDLVPDSRARGLASIVEGEIATFVEEYEHVDQVSDAIERLLLQEDETEIARAFILWRYRKEMLRSQGAPDPAALSEYTFHSKYARPGEDWTACVDRCKEMHLRRYPHLHEDISWAFDLVHQRKVLPSMRSLQFGGEAIESNHARMFNCSFSLCDRIEFFSESFFLLLSGCGVGYSVQKVHIDKLPEFEKIDSSFVIHHRVEDTIEGWANALRALISESQEGVYVEFVYDDIRPLGASLKTSGGVAPGHVPLKLALEAIRNALPQGRRMTPFEAHRIVCLTARAVLSGGVRRSSLIALFTNTDEEMMTCKTGDWMSSYPELAMANNSAVFLPDDEVGDEYFEAMREWGEPGFFHAEEPFHGTNPCGEIGLDPIHEGRTGFAFCNLTEIPARHLDIDTVKAAAVIGSLQAGYTDFPYLTDVSQIVAVRDSLLGISITGVMDQDLEFVGLVEEASTANKEIVEKMGINSAARLTCIKPSGTASLLLGGIGSGHHPHHAKRYFRRVTANPSELAAQLFKEANPHMVEVKPNGDWVITFPILAPDGARTRDEVGAIALMEAAARTQKEWVEPGSGWPPIHNVSLTVTVQENEWEAVAEWVRINRPRSMAFLPFVGDKKYPYAPLEAVVDVGDEARWRELIAKYRPVQYGGAGASSYGSACEGPACEISQ